MMKNLEDNMSNLTSCVSNEASVSSTNDILTPLPPKKKRNQPGHPDPNAEVIALSPKTLLTTNRFVCEICNKGFQRDQNLQLHRRGHNLPWKLKQRSASSSKEALRKKVYVCPETKCVHHDPSRALGDLTGIKKHFSRKHGEKKWKCDKCSKKYAVQSDWKAHSKICGTREYRCECGTLFSRRDNFITHRAFCDALSQRNATRHITIPVQQVQCPQGTITNNAIPHHQIIHQSQLFNSHSIINNNNMNIIQNKFPSPIKQEPQNLTLRSEIPPWLSPSPNIGPSLCGPPPSAAPTVDCTAAPPSSIIFHHFQRPNPNYPNNPTRGLPSPAGGLIMPPQQGDHGHHPELDLSSSRDHEVMMNYGNSNSNSNNNDDTKAGGGTDTVAVTGGGEIGGLHQFPCSSPLVFLHGFEGQGFEESLRFQSAIDEQLMMSSSSRNHSCIQGSTTRDFLGLGETDLFNFSNYFMDNSSNNNSQMNQAQKSWQG